MPLHRWRDTEAYMFSDASSFHPSSPEPALPAFQLVPLPGHLPPQTLEALKALYQQAFEAAQADLRAAKQQDRLKPHWN
ncbi:MAG TPA: hypothetical protein PKD86_16070 [Gemmatales bacterium]|nr:hypothetical protein [Gemmatales bacterium]HMP60862.1 hypothetical protein [Gemmatales bacterium]